MEDRTSLLLHLASCFLAFLSEVVGVLKSVEKVHIVVDPAGLKTVKERSLIPLFSYVPIQLSDEVFHYSARIQGTEEYFKQSGGRTTIQLAEGLDESLSISPFTPTDVLPVCLAFLRPLATMLQRISCQQHSAQGRRQNLTQTIKTTEIFMDLCGLH